MRIQFATFTSFIALAFANVHCGQTEEELSDSTENSHSNDVKQHDSGLEEVNSPATIEIEFTRVSAHSTDVFAHLDYSNSDFTFVIRCSAAWTLRRANGLPARSSQGNLVSMNSLEARAVWQGAIEATTHCTSFGDKLIRASFSDPIAQSGNYFYLFRPCKSPISISDSQLQTLSCSERLVSSPDISVHNTLSENKRKVFLQILQRESQIAGVTLRLRDQLNVALEAQKKCEENASVDAVQEARSKALATALGTSIAAAVGGAIAGPSAALAAARQTLSWITEYLGAGTQANPNKCGILKEAERQAHSIASQVDVLEKEISQLKSELADMEGHLDQEVRAF